MKISYKILTLISIFIIMCPLVSESAPGMGMGMGMSQELRQDQKLEHKLQQVQKLELSQVPRLELSLLGAFEDAFGQIIENLPEILRHPGVRSRKIKLFDRKGEGGEFIFYVFRSQGGDAPSYMGALRTAFELTGGGFALPSFYLAMVDGDRFPEKFWDMVGAHEIIEVLFEDHYKATIVELNVAARQRRLSEYLEWLRVEHAEKLSNVFLLEDPTERAVYEIERQIHSPKAEPGEAQTPPPPPQQVMAAFHARVTETGGLNWREQRFLQESVREDLNISGDAKEDWDAAWPKTALDTLLTIKAHTKRAINFLLVEMDKVVISVDGMSTAVPQKEYVGRFHLAFQNVVDGISRDSKMNRFNMGELSAAWQIKISDFNARVGRRMSELQEVFGSPEIPQALSYVSWISASPQKADGLDSGNPTLNRPLEDWFKKEECEAYLAPPQVP